jgi:hypothetical protein
MRLNLVFMVWWDGQSRDAGLTIGRGDRERDQQAMDNLHKPVRLANHGNSPGFCQLGNGSQQFRVNVSIKVNQVLAVGRFA